MQVMENLEAFKCEFSVDVVPYMYGEASKRVSSAFEDHLLDCELCTEELAAVSFARYEVYDWKKVEFDPLPTPRILPFADTAQVPVAASWLDGLRAVLGGGWLVPSSALAAVAIAVVFGISSLAERDSTDLYVAGVPEITTPTPSVTIPMVPDVFIDSQAVEPQPELKMTEVKTLTPKRSVRVARTNSVPTDSSVAQDVRTDVTQSAPRLNEFNDDEDTSLRLAMLFDDLDTRD